MSELGGWVIGVRARRRVIGVRTRRRSKRCQNQEEGL